MKLHTTDTESLNTVTAYGDDFIEINEVRYPHAVIFEPEGEIRTWDAISTADITSEALKTICGLDQKSADPMAFLDDDGPAVNADQPEVLLIGTGAKQILLAPSLLATLQKRGIGVEAMSTPAAARTYNVLMAEGRRVIAALLPTNEITL